MSERPNESLIATLVDACRGRTVLLVLDNCEHMLYAAASLADTLLDACPGLKVLATSREPLNVAGETNRPVSPLGVPDPRREPTAALLEGTESSRLFLMRAANRSPSFALTPSSARAVAEVCQGLAGIPLAIELAAVRVGTLSVEQISERLQDSLKLLTSRQQNGCAKTTNVARGSRLESRPALSCRTRLVPSVVGVRGRVDAGGNGVDRNW